MPAKTTSAYITTVRPDHTIVLPEEIQVGTTVAVVALPVEDENRKERFAATMDVINNAPQTKDAPPLSDIQLNELIKNAIKSSTA